MTDIPRPTPRRMLSLDALRGFDMLCIMGVEDVIREFARWHPTRVSEALAEQFEHVPWAGLHVYDLIFPLFMFLSGVSIPLSMDARLDRGDSRWKLWRKILTRCALLIVLGMVYNGVFSDKPVAPRYASVLGQIGVAWAIAASLQLVVRGKGTNFFIVRHRLVASRQLVVRDTHVRLGILFGWLAAVAVFQLLIPVPGHGAGVLTETGAINTWFDRWFLPGRLHGGTFDPEGILSALSAASITMAGSLVGTYLKRPTAYSWKTVGTLAAIGSATVLVGSACWAAGYLPIKSLWTATFDLLAIGISTMLFALFFGIIDVARFQSWSFPLRVIGMNSLTLYLGFKLVMFPEMSAFLFGRVAGLAGDAGPLLLLCGVVVLEWLALYFFYRQRWFWRV